MTTRPASPPTATHAPSRSGMPIGTPRAGAILRLKTGYNPNSSSIGSIVFGMPAALTVATVAFSTAASILCATLLRTRTGTQAAPKTSGADAPPTDPNADAPTPEADAPPTDPNADAPTPEADAPRAADGANAGSEAAPSVRRGENS